MHVFLTGDKGVGKSTIINSFLLTLNCNIGGFRTVRKICDGMAFVHMLDINKADSPGAGNIVAVRDVRGFHPCTEQFDAIGTAILSDIKDIELIVMDEIGPGESGAVHFQRAIISRLNGSIPIIGVLQKAESEFIDKIRRHANVLPIEVTEENRDEISCRLSAYLKI